MSEVEKGHLKISDAAGAPAIEGETRHIAALEALFNQRGLPCSRAASRVGREVLRLSPGANRALAEEVLEAYKAAKGS